MSCFPTTLPNGKLIVHNNNLYYQNNNEVTPYYYNDLGNLYTWKRTIVTEDSTYVLGTAQTLVMFDNINLAVNDTEPFLYSESVSISVDGTKIELVSPQTVYIKNNYGGQIPAASVLYGNFVKVNNKIYFFPLDCSVTGNYVSADSTPVKASKAQLVTGLPAGTTVDYPVSVNPNAYTPGTSAGTTIEYLGQLGDKARIEVGSYMGTGTKGAANPTSYTFGFLPKFVTISRNNASDRGFLIFNSNRGCVFESTSINNTQVYALGVAVTWNGNSVSWYSTYDANQQLNVSGGKYNVVAIG